MPSTVYLHSSLVSARATANSASAKYRIDFRSLYLCLFQGLSKLIHRHKYKDKNVNRGKEKAINEGDA